MKRKSSSVALAKGVCLLALQKVRKRPPDAALFFSRNGAEGAHIFETLLLTFLLDKHANAVFSFTCA